MPTARTCLPACPSIAFYRSGRTARGGQRPRALRSRRQHTLLLRVLPSLAYLPTMVTQRLQEQS